MSKLSDYMEEEKEQETSLIQAKIDKELKKKAVLKMNELKKSKKRINWNTVMTAAVKMFLAENL